MGDKTGSGERGTRNDVAILHWPPGGSPILIAAYLTQAAAAITGEQRNDALARVGNNVSSAFS